MTKGRTAQLTPPRLRRSLALGRGAQLPLWPGHLNLATPDDRTKSPTFSQIKGDKLKLLQNQLHTQVCCSPLSSTTLIKVSTSLRGPGQMAPPRRQTAPTVHQCSHRGIPRSPGQSGYCHSSTARWRMRSVSHGTTPSPPRLGAAPPCHSSCRRWCGAILLRPTPPPLSSSANPRPRRALGAAWPPPRGHLR